MSWHIPEPALLSTPISSSTPIYLEWKDLAVTLKSNEKKKPPPITTKNHDQEQHQQSIRRRSEGMNRQGNDSPVFQLLPQAPAPCSIITPPRHSSSIAAIDYRSPHSLLSPEQLVRSPQSVQHAQWPGSPTAQHQQLAQQHDTQQPNHSLPSPPNFSFLRSPVPFDLPPSLRSEPLASERDNKHARQESKDEMEARSGDVNDTSSSAEQDESNIPPLQIYHSPESAAERLKEPDPLNPTPLPPASIGAQLQQHQQECLSLQPHQQQPQFKAKFILSPLSGYALPGQLTVIMGGSGAGKTTLLNVLSGRHFSSTARFDKRSKVFMNGQEIPYASLSARSAAVQQNDLLLPCLTVREILEFAAVMKLPRSFSPEKRRQRVNTVIQELGLTKCQHFQVGSSGAGDGGDSSGSGGRGGNAANGEQEKDAGFSSGDSTAASSSSGPSSTGVARAGISGGEQRRLSIGMELVSDPQVLFLDEPTSGLDSSTAYTIILLLKRLAVSRGRTIILTIHSPSSKIFSLFDRLILLAPPSPLSSEEGAQIAYSGPANEVIEWFERLGFGPKALMFQRTFEFASDASSSPSIASTSVSSNLTISDFLMLVLDQRTEKGLRAELQARREEEKGMDEIDEEERKSQVPGTSEDELIFSAIATDEARLSYILTFYTQHPDIMPENLQLPSEREKKRQEIQQENEQKESGGKDFIS